MATTTETAKRYFEARSAHDLDTAVACWAPGAIDRLSPSAAWAGHADPVAGDVIAQLQQAASAPA